MSALGAIAGLSEFMPLDSFHHEKNSSPLFAWENDFFRWMILFCSSKIYIWIPCSRISELQQRDYHSSDYCRYSRKFTMWKASINFHSQHHFDMSNMPNKRRATCNCAWKTQSFDEVPVTSDSSGRKLYDLRNAYGYRNESIWKSRDWLCKC